MAEDDVQLALALLQASIKLYGPEDTLVVGSKKCVRFAQAMRGQKFLKENGFVTATVRVGTFVTEPYRNLAGVLEAIQKKVGQYFRYISAHNHYIYQY